MTERSLAKLYDTLSPQERAVAVLSALARDDEAEVDRLNASAPISYCGMPDHAIVMNSLCALAARHEAERLTLIAHFWMGLSAVSSDSLDEANCDVYLHTVFVAAYALPVKCEAWRRFCDEIGLNPDILLDCPDEWLLSATEKKMQALADSCDLQERVKMYSRKLGADGEPVTVESELEYSRGQYSMLSGDAVNR